MIDIFIPLGGVSGWQDNELRYCLRSLEANCEEQYRVTIYSDHPVDWIKDVEFRVMPRYRQNQNFENYFDTLNKIHEFAYESDCQQFIYMYDDCCLIKKVKDFYMFENIALQAEWPELTRMRTDKHGQTVLSAIGLLKRDQALFNYETHLPRIYDRERLLHLFDEYDILNLKIPSALATLYYNRYYSYPNGSIKGLRASFCFEDDPDSGCYLAVSVGEIHEACKGKTILHYNDVGLRFSPNGVPILKEYLQLLFPNPSKHENS